MTAVSTLDTVLAENRTPQRGAAPATAVADEHEHSRAVSHQLQTQTAPPLSVHAVLHVPCVRGTRGFLIEQRGLGDLRSRRRQEWPGVAAPGGSGALGASALCWVEIGAQNGEACSSYERVFLCWQAAPLQTRKA